MRSPARRLDAAWYHNAFNGDIASRIFLGDRIAIEDDIDQTQDHVASAIGKAWRVLVYSPVRVSIVLSTACEMRINPYGKLANRSQHAMPFVLHQSPAFTVAHVPLVLDAMLGTDIVRAHLESVVDGVDHNRFEVVISLGHKLASFEECLHE